MKCAVLCLVLLCSFVSFSEASVYGYIFTGFNLFDFFYDAFFANYDFGYFGFYEPFGVNFYGGYFDFDFFNGIVFYDFYYNSSFDFFYFSTITSFSTFLSFSFDPFLFDFDYEFPSLNEIYTESDSFSWSFSSFDTPSSSTMLLATPLVTLICSAI